MSSGLKIIIIKIYVTVLFSIQWVIWVTQVTQIIKKHQTKNNDNYIYVTVLFNIMGYLGNPSNPDKI